MNPDEVDPPERLWHYTSGAGARGIFTSGTLWAGHLGYMNDSSEFDHAVALSLEIALRLRDELEDHKAGLEKWINYLTDSPPIVRLTGARSLHELGAGTATKTRELLDALTARGRPALYAPLDISKEVLLEAADRLRTDYPALRVEPAVADFHHLPPLSGEPGERLLVFLGGTIGNFEEDERSGFLDMVHAALAPGDHLLLGADLVKDPDRLVAAYDDGAGVTARFNLNLVDVITRIVAGHPQSQIDDLLPWRWRAGIKKDPLPT